MNKIQSPDLIIENSTRTAAVLIPLFKAGAGTRILFETRSARTAMQSGDSCFPGGHIEQGETPQEAALRECSEELLLSASGIHIIKPLSVYFGTGLCIFPYLGILDAFPDSCNEEVSELFSVPLEFFLKTEPEKHIMEWKPFLPSDFPLELINGGSNYAWPRYPEEQLFYNYEGRIIWGITAKILRFNLDKIKEYA